MALKLNDKVQSNRGLQGEIVLFSADQFTVMVKLPGQGLGKGIVSIPLACLTRIPSYTPKPLNPQA